ncbi:MAG: DUF2993 domain-containing protein [Candidatus Sericytochromatia bacterium]|nr:DUF2993 domain-containing protein [Candidatus Sericytochromatia bacterium]
MIITIFSLILGLIIAIGGVVPNVASGMAETRLREALNQPEYLAVKMHPHAPSFSVLSTGVKYTEIEARRFMLADLPIESLEVRLDALSVNTAAEPATLREPTQGVVRVRLSEAGINQFLTSDTFRQLLDKLRSEKEILSQLDADLDHVQVDLQPDRVQLAGQASTMGGFFTVPFEMSGQLRLATERQLFVQQVNATTLGRPLAPDMVLAILESLNPVLDLSQLGGEDLQLYFRELTVRDGELELLGEARLKALPAF